jgi:hypothetical protein
MFNNNKSCLKYISYEYNYFHESKCFNNTTHMIFNYIFVFMC